MEFRLDDAQLDLQAAVARLCSDHFGFDSLRDAVVTVGVGADATGGAPATGTFDREGWDHLAELGVFSLLTPTDAGGTGLGVVDAALVFEQLGVHLVPGPTIFTLLAAELVEGALEGTAVVTGVIDTDIHDETALVPFGAQADGVLVLGDDSVSYHPATTLETAVSLQPLDPCTPVARISGLGGGAIVGGAETASRLRVRGTVLSAAGLSGVADRSLEVARTYAMDRKQFDAPIGSFQAIKHLLADGFVRARLAQSSVYAAAAVADDPASEDPLRAAACAKVVAADAAHANAAMAVQVLGGMGFTWDMPPNFLVKRAWVLDRCMGTAEHHAEHVGAAFVGAGQ